MRLRKLQRLLQLHLEKEPAKSIKIHTRAVDACERSCSKIKEDKKALTPSLHRFLPELELAAVTLWAAAAASTRKFSSTNK
jgi:hypothetical protein